MPDHEARRLVDAEWQHLVTIDLTEAVDHLVHAGATSQPRGAHRPDRSIAPDPPGIDRQSTPGTGLGHEANEVGDAVAIDIGDRTSEREAWQLLRARLGGDRLRGVHGTRGRGHRRDQRDGEQSRRKRATKPPHRSSVPQFCHHRPMAPPEMLWQPPSDVRARTRAGDYLRWLAEHRGRSFADYDELWQWSVDDLAGFWGSVWEYFELGPPPATVLPEQRMPGARWFPDVSLNYAEQALRLSKRREDDVVVIARSQTRGPSTLTVAELRDAVARARVGLRRLGVGRGDRVAAYLPNIPEAVIGLLATASLGAIWSSCAPEFGTRSVVDRFRQIEPKVLLTIDGYRYGDHEIDRREEVAQIRAALPSLASVVSVPYLGSGVDDATSWSDLLAQTDALVFESVPFDHPLYILYSSGTTGLPKPIVHGHGGILLEHLKIHALHHDLGAADRFFWFTTTGWMMWNYLVSGLLVDASIILFDGSPAHPSLDALWQLADETAMTYFGTSAPYLMSCRKAGLEPGATFDLSGLRGMGSTGAPLPAEGFRWVYSSVGSSLQLQSVSGGTDVCTAFVGGSPLVPVWAGEISCRHLGCRVESFTPDGTPVIGEQGELVISAPMPSMPVSFWNDPTGSRYREAYFADFPGVWRHGDWITITSRGSCVISGRSDATLNRGGVRVGTAEFYAVVEAFPEIVDSVVVHLEEQDELVLYVTLVADAVLSDDLLARLRSMLRRELSPRHVPDRIVAIPGVPRTLSGKKLEVPLKRILTGTAPEVACSRGSLANPEALDAFVALVHSESTGAGA
jgi:acetoacetyl-CoA synthetase